MAPVYTTLILDIGDVLFTWSPHTGTSIPASQLKRMLSCSTWFEYEKGLIDRETCYTSLAQDFSVSSSEISRAFSQAHESLRPNAEFISFLKELRIQTPGPVKLFAMSNISIPDYEELRTKHVDWDLFDGVFTSGYAGKRKPELGFFKDVLAQTGSMPHRTIFVDDKVENVLSARSLGIQGVVFDKTDTVRRALRNLLGNPVQRGTDFLHQNAGKLHSVADNLVELRENFAQLLILDIMADRSLVNLEECPRAWNFFQGKGTLTTEVFPFDLDTTSIGLSTIKRADTVVHGVLDEMLQYVNEDGIIQTYFDHNRPRFDPVVCVNTLSLFYMYGRGHEVEATLDWVYQVLFNRAYVGGTRYYIPAEAFLYFIMRFIQHSGDGELASRLTPLLKERVGELVGKEGDGLALAMRLLVCQFVGTKNSVDLKALLPLQCEDGGWEIGWIYAYGSSGIRIGNRGLTTALAIQAIEGGHKYGSFD